MTAQGWSYGQEALYKYPRGGFCLSPVITTIPVQQARVRDDVAVNSRFFFDMGAGLCLMLSDRFYKR